MGKYARLARVVVPVSLAVLFAAGFKVIRETPKEIQRKYDKMGMEAPGGRCYDNPTDLVWEKCKGYPTKRFREASSNQDHRKLIEWLADETRWHQESFISKRARADGNPDTMTWPTHEVQAIRNPQKLRYKAVPKRGTVLARIKIAPGSVEDAFYGLKYASDFGTTFYLVSEPYDSADTETVDEIQGDRWRISTWALYGVQTVDGTAKIVRVGKTGMISWCGHGHNDSIRNEGASFLTCKKQELVQSIRQNPVVMRTLREFGASDSGPGAVGPSDESTTWIVKTGQRLLRLSSTPGAVSVTLSPTVRMVLQPLVNWDFFTDPVWITCGIGCCIAET